MFETLYLESHCWQYIIFQMKFNYVLKRFLNNRKKIQLRILLFMWNNKYEFYFY